MPLPLPLCAAALFLRVDAALLGGAGRFGLLAYLGRDQGGPDQGLEAAERFAAILVLAALAARRNQDAAVVIESLAREPPQAVFDRRRQAEVRGQ